ncbi:cysteine proteinase, partial [Violaceomyces palustris]
KDEQILRYPFEGVGGVTLLNSDLWRLDEGEFLNDTVIEFGLKHMLEKIKGSNPELASQIHLFSSFFYKKLTEFGDRSEKGREKGYNNVKKWTNKVNLFEKRYIVVPINEYLHWYMAIIVSQSYGSRGQASTQGSPSSPRSRQHGKERGMPEDETLVIVFDSLQSSHGAVKTVMRDYLWLEARDKGQLRDPERNTRETAKVLHVDANVPIQPNHCDCGIYLLHFFDRFFSDPEAFTKLAWVSKVGRRRAEKSDSSQWNPELVPTRRQEWRTTILELSEEWKVKRAAEEQEKQERKRRMKKEQHQQHPSPRGLRSGLNHETREGEDDHDD